MDFVILKVCWFLFENKKMRIFLFYEVDETLANENLLKIVWKKIKKRRFVIFVSMNLFASLHTFTLPAQANIFSFRVLCCRVTTKKYLKRLYTCQ